MIRSLAIAATCLALSGGIAGAQTPADPATRIAAAKQQATSAGVPASLLDSKVAEGRAKGVSLDRIAGAIERRLASLLRARSVMEAGPAVRLMPDDLKVGADALEAGVDETVLSSLAQTVPADRRAVAVAVLTQLVQQGEGSAEALKRVKLALEQGPASLRTLPAQAAAEAKQRPAHAAGPPAHAKGGVNPVGPTARGRGGPPAAVPPVGTAAGENRPQQGKGKKP